MVLADYAPQLFKDSPKAILVLLCLSINGNTRFCRIDIRRFSIIVITFSK